MDVIRSDVSNSIGALVTGLDIYLLFIIHYLYIMTIIYK